MGTLASVLASVGTEEMRYLRRKVEERQKELDALQQERARLQGMLQRHTDIEAQHGDAGGAFGATETGNGPWKPLDEPMSRLVMLLFKSIFVRRFFCVHL